jgi:flavodoxin I
MKLTTANTARYFLVAAVAVTSSVDAFTPSLSHKLRTSSSSSALWAKVGIWYSSSTGNTDTVAGYIAKAAGVDDYNDIGDAKNEEMESADALIVGAPTWHTGADTERSGTSWDDW